MAGITDYCKENGLLVKGMIVDDLGYLFLFSPGERRKEGKKKDSTGVSIKQSIAR